MYRHLGDVADVDAGLARGGQDHGRVTFRVAGCRYDRDFIRNLVFTIEQVQASVLLERQDVFGDIGGAGALVGLDSLAPLGLHDQVLGVWEGGDGDAIDETRVPAAVVGV